MSKFSLKHTVLYAKHWYKRSPNFWNDIMKCLEADGYLGTFIDDSEEQIRNRAAYLIVTQFGRLKNKNHVTSLESFFEGIKPHNVWKYGYYTKNYSFLRSKEEVDKSPDYEYNEAAVRYCLSCFVGLDKEEWDVCEPDYKNVLPRRNGISNKKIKEIFKKETA